MPVSYEQIKNEVEKRGEMLKIFIPRYAKLSVQGFKLAVEKQTLKVSTLELISRQLKVPMSRWFQDEDTLIVNETEATYGENSAMIIRRLNLQIDSYLDNEKRMKKEIDELRAQLGKIGP